MRTPENLQEVIALHPDYVGFIFYDKSKRYVGGTGLATWIAAHGEAFGEVKKVGVFVNAEVDYILNTVHDYKLDYVQLHGNESPGYCAELKLLWSVSTLRKAEIIKAFSVTPDFDFATTLAYAGSCSFFIFDTGGQAEHGGTGVKWDWSKLDEYTGLTPFLLSGGIGPGDAEAVRQLTHPQFTGVDVNSGFEVAAAEKNAAQLSSFITAVR